MWGRQSSLFGHRSTLDLRGKAVLVPPHRTAEIRRIRNAETHGSRRFAEELRRRGIRAEFLGRKPQMRLF